jgi:hypothetical protein
MAQVEPSHPAPVLLFELVALIGVDQVVGEIGEQIEIVIEPVGHDLWFRNLRPCDAIPTASYNDANGRRPRVQRAEETDDGYGRIGELIARVPSRPA